MVDLNTSTAPLAADLRRHHGLSFADVVTYASERKYKLKIVTFDNLFDGLRGITHFIRV